MNNSPILDFSETLYDWWDTYSDVLSLPYVVSAIDSTITYLEEDTDFEGETYGDKIRYVFSKEKWLCEFFKSLRESQEFWTNEIKKIIAIILVIEHLKDLVNNQICSIQEATSQQIMYLIEDKSNTTITTGWDDEWIEEITMSVYSRFESLLGMWFPIISAEGDIVMFCKRIEDDDETALVWNSDSGETLTMNKNWNIIFPDENEDGDWEKIKKHPFELVKWWKE